MNNNIAFSSSGMFLFIGLVIAATLFFIFMTRWWFSKKSPQNLTEKYKDWNWTSPLDGRNKYPEVNVFQFSNSIFLFGLLISLGITFASLNWTSFEKAVYIPENALVVEEDIEVEPPRSDVQPPPPPPPPPPVIQEIPDEISLEEEVEFLDQSIDVSTEMAESVVPDAPEIVEKAAPPPPPPPPIAEPEVEEIFQVVEEMPRFGGCEHEPDKTKRKACADKRMLEFIYSNIKYPAIAREAGISGVVVIRFYVDKDGSVKEPKIVKEIGGGCGTEAVRVINLMNKNDRWIAGRQRGKPVKVWFNLPVRFQLI